MLTGTTTLTWDEAMRGFFRHLKAVRVPKPLRFYEVQLNGLVRRVNCKGIRLEAFLKRHLDD